MRKQTTLPKLTLAIVLALLLMGLATLAFAQDAPDAPDMPTAGSDFPLPLTPNIDGSLNQADEPLFFVGDYCGGFGGVSLRHQQSGTFTVPVIGQVKGVYLVWSGRNKENGGDDTISVSINGGPVQTVTSNPATALTAISDFGYNWFTYSYNASADNWPFQQGINTITVSGLTDGVSQTFEPHGVGMLLISEDQDMCPFQAIGLYYGNDVLFHGWDGASGPNTEVTCLDVLSPPDPVEIDIQMFVGGVENELRSNAVWAETGSGAPPTNIIGDADAVEIQMALKGLQGFEFDNYDTVVQDPQPIMLEPGENWACVQIESPPQPYPGKEQGISATWINLAVRVPLLEINIAPDGLNPVGTPHTFTVTVNSSTGFDSLVITPTVQPAPTSQSDTCATPDINGGIATCTITINSDVAAVYTATAEAAAVITFNNQSYTAYVSTSQARESSGAAVKEYYEVPTPAIDLEKATNGEDADTPTGPYVDVGGAVTWTYRIENTGDMDLVDVTLTDDNGTPGDASDDYTCAVGDLAIGAVDDTTCTRTGVAEAGQYANIADVVGTPIINGDPSPDKVTDTDPSHYYGVSSSIDIEKATNGQDADTPTGPYIEVGDPVAWTYEVTNTSNVTLIDVTVVDDQGVAVTCPQDTLDPGESMICTGVGVAVAGQYANEATVTGRDPTGASVTDKDPSHYFGSEPAIDIEKATNGEDADEPTGPKVDEGSTINWTYEVTNIGNVTLTNVAVTDDQNVSVTCPKDTLDPGESMTCTAQGVAVLGQYANLGTVTGVSPTGKQVTDTDPSHYFGGEVTGIDDPDIPGPDVHDSYIYLPLINFQ
jgi:uncharacterized repeat protein (TIGR01451 family)